MWALDTDSIYICFRKTFKLMSTYKKVVLRAVFATMSLPVLGFAQSDLTVQLRDRNVTINTKGQIAYIGKADSTDNLLLTDSVSSLLRIKRFGQTQSENPRKLSWVDKGKSTILNFDFDGPKVEVLLTKNPDYLKFEVLNVEHEDKVELLQWGQIYTRLDGNVGQSLGAVYNASDAVGLMGLNIKSSGGFEIDHRERFGNAAQRLVKGSVLQGFTRNRSKQRQDDNFIQELTEAVPVHGDDARLKGSAFALYTTDSASLPRVIEGIEIKEGLPHLTHSGEWIKRSLYSTSSKFIISFTEQNIDECLDIAQRAGITNVYHPGIFKTWGTYQLDSKAFPNGTRSLALCSDKAKQRNMNLGAHTLTNFITTDDPLVSPKPHPGLQLAAVTALQTSIGTDDSSILLQNSTLIKAYIKDELLPSKTDNNVNQNREIFAIRIGDEIIEYAAAKVSGRLIELSGCKRGAFGTTASTHQKGQRVGRLASHAYKVFFADINLQDSVAMNLARFFNEGKLERISFDGVEGGVATGHNRYGGERFVDVFFKHLENKNIVANSSDVMHYAWHYFSNESWGEPWWAKSFRESQLDHRLGVQKALKEDLLPRKMGQFSIKENTTLKDINWIMGLCAGFDNGVDFYVSPAIIKANPDGEAILTAIKRWETVRMMKTLSDEQKENLRNVFTLYELTGELNNPSLRIIETWAPEGGQLQKENDRVTLPINLLERTQNTIITFDYRHHSQVTEPGKPTHSEVTFNSSGESQPLRFAIRVSATAKEKVEGLLLKSGTRQLDIPFVLNPGDYVILDRDKSLKQFDSNGMLLNSTRPRQLFNINKGENIILIDYKALRDKSGPEVILNVAFDK